jgi:hypothetical protein
LRFGSAGAGLHRDDSVELVGFAGHQNFRLKLGEIGVGGEKFFVDVLKQRIALRVVRFFLRQADIGFNVAGAPV